MIKATLLRRYKRFLADVVLDDGTQVTVHCPNPGAMTGLMDVGSEVWLKTAKKSAKLPYGWQMVKTANSLVGIDTGRANQIVEQALIAGKMPMFAKYTNIRREVQIDNALFSGTRLDFLLNTAAGDAPYYLEVKSVTLLDEDCIARFPDTCTARGRKHLDCLCALKRAGYGAGVLFLVQRSDAFGFGVAAQIDPAYATGYREARGEGVDIFAWDCRLNVVTNDISVREELPCVEEGHGKTG